MVNKLAKDSQENGYVSTDLFEAVKKVSYKIFTRYGLPREEFESEAFILITTLLKTWDGKKDFALYLFNSSGYAVQKYRAYATVVRTPMKVKIQTHDTIDPAFEKGDGSFSVSNLDASFQLDAIHTALKGKAILRATLDLLIEGYPQKEICKKLNIKAPKVSRNVKELRAICKELIFNKEQ